MTAPFASGIFQTEKAEPRQYGVVGIAAASLDMNAKYYADNVDRALRSGAAIPSESEYLHEGFKRFTLIASTEPPTAPPAPAGLSGLEKIKVMMFSDKLLANTELVPSLLSEADDWTEAHFEQLLKRSPRALIRFAMAHRDWNHLLQIFLEATSPLCSVAPGRSRDK